ncbi:MAG: TIGR00300 family protein, partial [Gemmataceae bacterium]
MQCYAEIVEVRGHIIDSLLLPKILDEILTRGGNYVIKEIQVGQRPEDPSHARIEVRAPSAEVMEAILDNIHD